MPPLLAPLTRSAARAVETAMAKQMPKILGLLKNLLPEGYLEVSQKLLTDKEFAGMVKQEVKEQVERGVSYPDAFKQVISSKVSPQASPKTIMLTGATRSHGFTALTPSDVDKIKALPKDTRVLIGDEPSGADRAFQTLLKQEGFTNVTVYYAGGSPRFNAGFPAERIQPKAGQSWLDAQRGKDRAMLSEADEVIGSTQLGPSSKTYVAQKGAPAGPPSQGEVSGPPQEPQRRMIEIVRKGFKSPDVPGVLDVHRANGGRSHMNNTEPGQPGWLGNPYQVKSAGGQYTVEESVRLFKADLAKKYATDPKFKATLNQAYQRGDKIGYYNPGLKGNHAEALRDFMSELPVSTGGTLSQTPRNIYYGTGENKELSNLALRPFKAKDGRTYYSVEHAYQTNKSGKFDAQLYTHPSWKKGGVKIPGKMGTDTSKNIPLIEDYILDSFQQNPAALDLLIKTGTDTLTHKRPGYNLGMWEEEFPKALTRVRETLKNVPRETSQYAPDLAGPAASQPALAGPGPGPGPEATQNTLGIPRDYDGGLVTPKIEALRPTTAAFNTREDAIEHLKKLKTYLTERHGPTAYNRLSKLFATLQGMELEGWPVLNRNFETSVAEAASRMDVPKGLFEGLSVHDYNALKVFNGTAELTPRKLAGFGEIIDSVGPPLRPIMFPRAREVLDTWKRAEEVRPIGPRDPQKLSQRAPQRVQDALEPSILPKLPQNIRDYMDIIQPNRHGRIGQEIPGQPALFSREEVPTRGPEVGPYKKRVGDLYKTMQENPEVEWNVGNAGDMALLQGQWRGDIGALEWPENPLPANAGLVPLPFETGYNASDIPSLKEGDPSPFGFKTMLNLRNEGVRNLDKAKRLIDEKMQMLSMQTETPILGPSKLDKKKLPKALQHYLDRAIEKFNRRILRTPGGEGVDTTLPQRFGGNTEHTIQSIKEVMTDDDLIVRLHAAEVEDPRKLYNQGLTVFGDERVGYDPIMDALGNEQTRILSAVAERYGGLENVPPTLRTQLEHASGIKYLAGKAAQEYVQNNPAKPGINVWKNTEERVLAPKNKKKVEQIEGSDATALAANEGEVKLGFGGDPNVQTGIAPELSYQEFLEGDRLTSPLNRYRYGPERMNKPTWENEQPLSAIELERIKDVENPSSFDPGYYQVKGANGETIANVLVTDVGKTQKIKVIYQDPNFKQYNLGLHGSLDTLVDKLTKGALRRKTVGKGSGRTTTEFAIPGHPDISITQILQHPSAIQPFRGAPNYPKPGVTHKGYLTRRTDYQEEESKVLERLRSQEGKQERVTRVLKKRDVLDPNVIHREKGQPWPPLKPVPPPTTQGGQHE